MSENTNLKCPYCGSSFLEEADGYRCRMCKSFFPFETFEGAEQGEPLNLSQVEQGITEKEKTPEELAKEAEDKAFARVRARNEFIGIITAFASLILLFLTKTMKEPLLMIPGFILWAFSAGYTGYQIYSAKKQGRKAAFFRIFALLLVAILVTLFVRIAE